MSNRRTLQTRRAAESFEFAHDGFRYHATIGRFDDGQMAEIFIDCEKTGSTAAANAANAAVVASIAMQFGAPVEVIRHAIAGPLAAAIDLAEAGL